MATVWVYPLAIELLKIYLTGLILNCAGNFSWDVIRTVKEQFCPALFRVISDSPPDRITSPTWRDVGRSRRVILSTTTACAHLRRPGRRKARNSPRELRFSAINLLRGAGRPTNALSSIRHPSFIRPHLTRKEAAVDSLRRWNLHNVDKKIEFLRLESTKKGKIPVIWFNIKICKKQA